MSSTKFPKPAAATKTTKSRRRQTYRHAADVQQRIINSNSMTTMPGLEQQIEEHVQQNTDQEAAANHTLPPHMDQHHTNSQIDGDIGHQAHILHDLHDGPNTITQSDGHQDKNGIDNIHEGQTYLPLAAAINFDEEAQSDQDELDDMCTDMLANSTVEPTDIPNEDIPQFEAPGSPTTPSVRDIFRHIRRGIRYVVSWDRMLSYLSLHGRVTFTKHHYAVMAAAVKTASDGNNCLNHWNRVKDAQATFIKSFCLPKNNLYYVQSSKASARTKTQVTAKTNDGSYHDVRDCTRVVLPSEWAKLDLITYPIFEQLYSTDSMEDNDAMTIERSILRLPSLRRTAFGGRLSLWALHNNGMVPSSLNNRIRFQETTTNIESTSQNNFLHPWFDNSHQTEQQSSTVHHISGKVGPMWCAGTGGSNVDVCTSYKSNMFDHEKIVFNALSTATRSLNELGFGASGGRHQTHSNASIPSVQIYPADFCAFIRPSIINNNTVCLLICSFLGRGANNPAERLVWITLDSISSVHEMVVSEPPILLEHTSSFGDRHSDKQITNHGTLQDGRPYYIYRFLLYQDGFAQKKSLGDTRSVTGAYLLPVGLNDHYRKSCAAARVINLGGDGQPANDLMNIVLEDIVTGAANGIECFNAVGEHCVVFLDPVGLVADWPALAALTDAIGHSGNVFCSFCIIPRSKGSAAAAIVYTSKLHSRRMSLMRFDARMDIVRNHGVLSEELRKHVGLKSNTREKAAAYFTEKLSLELYLRSQQPLPKSSTGRVANLCHFDSFLSAPAAPDHLLTGLIKDVLQLCFTELGTDESRKRVDSVICCYISSNNLPRIDAVLRWSSGGETTRHQRIVQLNNLTMTNLFCILLFASNVFKLETYTAAASMTVHPFHLPGLLQDVISKIYWLPKKDTSTSAEFNYVRKSEAYHGNLLNLASKYIDEAGKYILAGGRHGHLLDKPNAHRLLELCAHSLPVYQHATNISEMVLESVHQNFKGWMEKNSNHEAHITAVDMALTKDWASRLYALWHYYDKGNAKEKEASYRGLVRLCLGEATADTAFTSTNPALLQLLSGFKIQLASVFREPILLMLKGIGRNNLLPVAHQQWITYGMLPSTQIATDLRTGGRLLAQFYSEPHKAQMEDATYYSTAKFVTVDKYAGSRRLQSYNFLRRGSVFSIFTNDFHSNIVTAASTQAATQVFFCVIGFLSFDDKRLWGTARRMASSDGIFFHVTNRLQVVRLSQSVRTAVSLHKCDDNCKEFTSGVFHHSSDILDGGQWSILASKAGFPPHMG